MLPSNKQFIACYAKIFYCSMLCLTILRVEQPVPLKVLPYIWQIYFDQTDVVAMRPDSVLSPSQVSNPYLHSLISDPRAFRLYLYLDFMLWMHLKHKICSQVHTKPSISHHKGNHIYTV